MTHNYQLNIDTIADMTRKLKALVSQCNDLKLEIDILAQATAWNGDFLTTDCKHVISMNEGTLTVRSLDDINAKEHRP